MPDIQQLDPHVADLIAAGEVVERPASVVKELMENAIDAGASNLTVEIANGGMTLIRVTDDGCGMAPDQVATAFLRHATSKIRTETDLEAIGTLGFRGEALAAIAAVARVEVLTRTADSPFGASLALEGGIPGPVEEVGCPLGTTMLVRNLFYNTPARLKFMKRDSAEGAAVTGVVERVALSHPEVSVKFLREGKQELLTPGDGQLRSAIYSVLGRDLALGFLPVKGSGENVKVEGFVSMPACCRGTRGYQHFFVNGRYVKSRLMTAALEEAYKNQKMVGKFPGCVLHITTRPGAVDVNVHPTKTEVKFVSEKQVFDGVYYTVLSALNGDASRPAAELAPRPAPHDTVTPNQTVLRSSFPSGMGPKPGSVPVRPVESAPTVRPASGGAPAPERKTAPVTTAPPARPAAAPKPEGKPTPFVYTPTVITPKEPAPPEVSVRPKAPAAQTVSKPAETLSAPLVSTPAPPEPAGEPVSAVSVPEAAPELPAEPDWRIAGEVLRTYIIAEQGDKILFIDKHAAHERMNFDRLKAEDYDPMSQQLLVPAVVKLPAEEQEVLLSQLPLLERYGFEVEEFGAGALTVLRAPFDLPADRVEETLSELAHRLLTTGSADPASARDELLHTMACKAAIKGGWKSADQELEAVAAAVLRGEVKYCPHGRPVAIEMTKQQLEKQFKR